MSDQSIITRPPLPDRIGRLAELASDIWWVWNPAARSVFRELDYGLWRSSAHNPVRLLRLIPAERLEQAARDPMFLRPLRPGDQGARSRPQRRRQLVGAAPRQRADARHRLLLGRVRPAPVAADLRRRPRRAGRRSLQGSQRPGRAARRHRLHVPAGLLPPERVVGRLAGRALPPAELGGRADRAGAHARRQAVRHRRAARPAHGARLGVARQARPHAALPARHRPRRERAVGSRAVGAPLRRRPRDAHPAGDHPRHRRRPRRCARSASIRRCGTSTRATPASWCCSASTSSSSRACRSTTPSTDVRQIAPSSRPTRRCPPATTPSRSTRSKRTSPAAGAASAIAARTSWRSAATTTATARMFNMTALALRSANYVNAVSQLHGEVTREMWAPLWPGAEPARCRSTSITNGVHLRDLARRRHGAACSIAISTRTGAIGCDEPAIWERILAIPDDELWKLRDVLREYPDRLRARARPRALDARARQRRPRRRRRHAALAATC